MYRLRFFVSIENYLVDLLKQAIEKEISPQILDRFEVVNVLRNPEIALENNILMTPTLLRLKPEPSKRIVGNFSRINDIVKELCL